MVRRARVLCFLGAVALVGCDSIFGIQSRPFAGDSGSPDASAASVGMDGGSDSATPEAGQDSTTSEGGMDSGTMDATLMDTGADAGQDVALTDTGPSTDGMARADATSDARSCTNACTESAMQCATGAVQTCTMQSNGCTQWTTSTTCGTHETCTGTGSSSACTCASSVCTGAGTTCQDAQTLATCVVDSQGCDYVASTVTCSSPKSCSGASPSAACSTTCTSSCSSGQATCVSGSLATCTLGGNGCYAYGTAVACPGPRQNCSGSAGTAACTCKADAACTSASNVCASPSMVANCTQDAYGCFYQASSTSCSSSTPACLNGSCVACAPGATQCSANVVQTCSATGSWGAPTTTCNNQTCVQNGTVASCTGQCAPSQTHPVACGNCGIDTQTCSASGTWQSSGTCTGQGACAPTATQACNTYGTQTCSPSCGWGACSCASAPVCTPYATQCSGSSSFQTCDACGQGGSAVTCSGTTPVCASGACTSTPPSCQTSGAGLTNCGASSESCCTSLEVAGGSYNRTYTNSGSGPTGEADPAAVSGFRLDKYLVTVGRFRQFVNAWNGGAGYTPPAGSGKHTHLNGGSGLSATGGGYEPGWVTSDNSNIAPTNANLACDATYGTWTTSAGSNENLPINCVNWWESYAFCIWDGGFLPSEAEWEYAAAGGSQQREYPWGTAAPGTASQYAIYGCYYPSVPASCNGVTTIAPVGTATSGAGLWGQLDLAGEMIEWNLDWYAFSYVDPCTDCANLKPNSGRVIRGGNFYNDASFLAPSYRNDLNPPYRNGYIGLRCSRTP